MPRKSWWARLPFGVRMAAGAGALLVLVGGGAAGVAALTRDGEKPRMVTAVGQAATAARPAELRPEATTPRRPAARAPFGPVDASAPRTSEKADRTATRNPRAAAQRAQAPAPAASDDSAAPAAAAARPVLTTRTETETREIPYETRLVRDPKMPRGAKRVETPGVPGEETLRYLVTLTDGQPTDRRLVDATVTRQPQHRVVALGSRRGGRECGHTLNFCVPLGRSAICLTPDDAHTASVDGSTGALDEEIEQLGADLDELACGTGPAGRDG